MNKTTTTTLRRFALGAALGSAVVAQGQAVPGSSFTSNSGAPPSASPSKPDVARDAPGNAHPVILPPPSVDPPLVLPRNFRITPAAARSDTPGKLRYYLGSTWSIRNLIEAALVAGMPNVPDPPLEPALPTEDTPAADYAYQVAMDKWGDDMRAWGDVVEANARYTGRRFGVGLAAAETRDLMSNLVLPVALHQQAAYLPAPVDAAFSDRMWNAASSIVVTRNDRGDVVPNYSKLGGTVLAGLLAKDVYANAFDAPELDTSSFFVRYVGYSLLGDLVTNTAHELVRAAQQPDNTFYAIHGRATDDSYYPLSLGGKVIYWLRSTYTPRDFLSAAFLASLPHIPKRPAEPTGNPATWNGFSNYDDAYNNYGESLLQWKDTLEETARDKGRRFGGGLAETESQVFLQNLLIPVAFNMDPRYVPLGTGYSTSQRFGHAFTGLVVGHNDAGDKTLNLPVLGGTIGAAFAAKELYYPQLQVPELATTGVLVKTIGLNLAADGIYNVVSEFFRHRTY